MQVTLGQIIGTTLTTLLIGTIVVGAANDGGRNASSIDSSIAARNDDAYGKVARPFIEQHCMTCHGAKKAKAGFRIDLLAADFTAPKAADQWKLIADRIKHGEMPPEGKAQPDRAQATAFVGWIDSRLHAVELAAKQSGGRVLMRRLNRDEYANTVRDLLKLDGKVVGPIAEELPGDGRAEGFDRLGVALYFDQAQIERSLAVSGKIAARAIVTEPPKVNHLANRFSEARRQWLKETVPVYPSSTHMIPRGATDYIVKPEFVEYIQGYPTWRKDYDGWGVINHYGVNAVVTTDGFYRFRIKAKVDNRGRTTPNKFRLQYGLDSPIETETEVPVDESGTTEVTMFLRGPDGNGEVKGPQVFNLLWNHTEKAVINEPSYFKAFSTRTRLDSEMERAATRRAPKAEQDELRKQMDACIDVLE